MKRTWALVGAVALAVVAAAAGTQAQVPGTPGTEDAQGRPGARMEQRMSPRGPQQGPGLQGPGRGMMRGRGPGQGQGPQGAMRGRGPGGPGQRGGGFGLRGLDLTEDQKTQIKAIHEQTRQAIDNILTPEQKAKRRGGR